MVAALYFLLLLHLLIGSCPVFYAVCLFCCDIDVQLSYQRFGGRLRGLFGFPFLAIFAGSLFFNFLILI